MSAGKPGALADIRPDAIGTANYFAKAMCRAPILEVIGFLDKSKKEKVVESLLQHADDLDYLQQLVTSLGKRPELNPSLNAVIEASNRGRFYGRYKKDRQSVE